jgi:retinol dehydrogenase 12
MEESSSSTSTSSWKIIIITLLLSVLIVIPPLVALLYTICVWLTYAINHEIKWTSKLTSIFKRLIFVIASIGVTAGLALGNNQLLLQIDDNNINNDNTSVWPRFILSLSTIVIGTISLSVSWMFIKQTRRDDVVGVPVDLIIPPFYGCDKLKDQIIVVTGANSGVGKETTRQLASMGATVVLLCRSPRKAQEAIDDILMSSTSTTNSSNSTPISRQQLVFIPMDLSHFESIHCAVDQLRREVLLHEKSKTKRLVNVLINNAGLMMGRQTLSKHDKLEMMMQANHLGHYLLTRLLIDQGLLDTQSGNGRVINLTSSTYEFSATGRPNGGYGFDFDDMFCDQGLRPYTLFGQYSMTKLANILMIKELHHLYGGNGDNGNDNDDKLLVYAVHPGIVRTNVTSHMQWYWQLPNQIFAVIVKQLQKTPTEGAYSTVFCASASCDDDRLPPNGSYVVNCQSYPTLDCANSVVDAKRLWDVSEELVGLAGKKTKNSNNNNNNSNKRQDTTYTEEESTSVASSSSTMEEKKTN